MKNHITFQVEKIRFRKEENGWSVLSVRDINTSKPVVTAGVFHQVNIGEVICSKGKWHNHHLFGQQWLSESFEIKDPTDHTTLLKFIHQVIFAEIDGLGKTKAKKIIATFGDDTLAIMETDPTRLADIKGITPKHVTQIKTVWAKHQASKDALLFLTSHGLSVEKSQRIIGALSTHDLSEFKSNPYSLIHKVTGIGFKLIDQIAQSCGIHRNDSQRIQAAILHLIQVRAAQYGHTCIPAVFLQHRLPEFLGLSQTEIQLNDHLDALSAQNYLILQQAAWQELDPAKQHLLSPYHPDQTQPVQYCYLPKIYEEELNLAQNVIQKHLTTKQPLTTTTFKQWMQDYQTESRIDLSAQQQQAVYHALVEPLFILTGGAGVGKTTTLKAILWAAKRLDLHVGLASPTGRGAQRIKEITAKPAKTLHRLLEWSPHEHSFNRHEDRTLAEDLIIVDECSMMDLFLARALFAALRPKSRIVIMGDPHQLPSVGVGAILKDLIATKLIPVITLTQIFRQALHSPIIRASQAILCGEVPEFCQTKTPSSSLPSPSSPPSPQSSWCHYEYLKSAPQIKAQMIRLFEDNLSHLDPLKDVQILTPMNKGELGCDSLNHFLQHYFLSRRAAPAAPSLQNKSKLKRPVNTNQHTGSWVDLQVGDKVIQTVNNYELQVFNGDIGYVIHLETSKQQTLEQVIVEYRDGHTTRHVNFSADFLKDLRLAYAITIHKSQGSEFPAIILPVIRQHQHMITSNLLYTAFTRAKDNLVVLGDADIIHQALKHYAPPRFTRLTALIKSYEDNFQAHQDDLSSAHHSLPPSTQL